MYQSNPSPLAVGLAALLLLLAGVGCGNEDGGGSDEPLVIIITEDASNNSPQDSAMDVQDVPDIDPEDCPIECTPSDSCHTSRVVLDGATCESARCVEDPVTACSDDDGCCPSGCNSLDDNDCVPGCGNGVLEGDEICDGDCPTIADCDDGVGCTEDFIEGSASQCDAVCKNEPITECSPGVVDGCCPSGCTQEDYDCPLECGERYTELLTQSGADYPSATYGPSGAVHAVWLGSVRRADSIWIRTRIQYATNANGDWHVETIYNPEGRRWFVPAGPVVASDGTVHLVGADHHFAIYHLMRSPAGNWSIEQIEDAPALANDLEIDSDDRLHLVAGFDDDASDEGTVFYGTRPSGGNWTFETVATNSSVLQHPLVYLDLDDQDEPHVTYVWNNTDGSEDLRYSYRESSDWVSTQIPDPNGDPSTGFDYPDIAVSTNGTVTIIYRRFSDDPVEQLMIAEKSQQGWQFTKFDGEPGRFVVHGHIKIGPRGIRHVHWMQPTPDGNKVKYAHDSDGSWTEEELEIDAERPAMTFEEGGRPVVFYDSALKLMHLCPPEAACTPSCSGISCGTDGCGGTCTDNCPQDKQLCVGNSCLCEPDCSGKECGPDGCGGTCGGCYGGEQCYGSTCACGPGVCGPRCDTCGPNETCDQGQCICVPDCSSKACGDDGCGGSCGTCPSGESCDSQSQCCTPDCSGKVCGDDGCGGSCGSCSLGEVCTSGQCCVPDCSGKVCGDDGCGGSCGSCPTGKSCLSGQCDYPEGECDPVTQTGCTSNEYCGYASGQSLCVSAFRGTRGPAEPCNADNECAPGLLCYTLNLWTESCREYCRHDSDCTGDSECVFSLSSSTDLGVCSTSCNVFGSGTSGCYNFQSCYVTDIGLHNEVTDCRRRGSGFAGDSCTNPEDCFEGYTCLNGTCRQLCPRGTACNNGS